MIITTNNNTITVGPAWPCCYEYSTQAPNITGNHENVSFEEIKRRFYNSPKSATFTIPNLKVYYDPDTQANAFNPNGQNVTAEVLESWSEALANLLSGETMTLYGNQWFHSDENGTGYYGEFFLRNKKKIEVNVLGETIEGILDGTVIGSVGPGTLLMGQTAEMLELFVNFRTLTTASGKSASLSFAITKFIDKTLSNFVIGDFNGNFGPRTTPWTPTYLLYSGPSWPNQYLTRQIVGEGGLSESSYRGVGARLQLDGNCNVTFAPVTTSDWDFDLNGFTIASSGQNQFGSITTPGQDLDQINDLLNAPNLNYTATGTGIFKHDPVNIGIGNYPGWPSTMYYDCRKLVPPTYDKPLDVGGVFFNSPNLNYYNFGPAFYLKPYLIPIEGITSYAYQSNTSADPYINGIITHPDAPKVIVDIYTSISNWFDENSAPGDYYYTGVKMSTPSKYINVYFRFFEYRINRSQAGGAYITGYMPPFQDW
jgi:hypothetical protein